MKITGDFPEDWYKHVKTLRGIVSSEAYAAFRVGVRPFANDDEARKWARANRDAPLASYGHRPCCEGTCKCDNPCQDWSRWDLSAVLSDADEIGSPIMEAATVAWCAAERNAGRGDPVSRAILERC